MIPPAFPRPSGVSAGSKWEIWALNASPSTLRVEVQSEIELRSAGQETGRVVSGMGVLAQARRHDPTRGDHRQPRET